MDIVAGGRTVDLEVELWTSRPEIELWIWR